MGHETEIQSESPVLRYSSKGPRQMLFLVMVFVYSWIYGVVYFGLLYLVGTIAQLLLGMEPFSGDLIDKLPSPLSELMVVLLVGTFLFVGYRAKLSEETFGDGEMNLWTAHRASGVILKAQLSFLPLIGRFFVDESKGSPPN